MSFALSVKPHPHDATRRGVIEDFIGASPIGLGLVIFTVSAHKKTRDEATKYHQDDDSPNDSHDWLRVLGERDRCTVGHDLREALAHLRRVEPH
jgi:hypothetical protein